MMDVCVETGLDLSPERIYVNERLSKVDELISWPTGKI